MNNFLVVFIFSIFLISYSTCDSEPSSSVIEGDDFKFSLLGFEKAVGIKRTLFGEGVPEGWQYYYLCEKSKGELKKKCGSWVDEKGNKIKNGNKVALKGTDLIISEISVKEGGRYTVIFEDPKDESLGLRLYVGTRPPPPPKY